MKRTQALGRRRGKRVYQLLGDGVAKALSSKAGSGELMQERYHVTWKFEARMACWLSKYSVPLIPNFS